MSNFKRQSFPMSVNQDSSRVANFYKKSLVKRLCFFIHLSFFLFPAFSFAQTKQIDSLKKVLPKLTDSLRVDCFNQLSLQYILSDKKDSGEYYSTLAYNEAKKLN